MLFDQILSLRHLLSHFCMIIHKVSSTIITSSQTAFKLFTHC